MLGGSARRGSPDRRRTRLAVRRGGDRGGPRRGGGARTAQRRPVAVIDLQRIGMRTDHLLTLVDDVGIVQHANGVIPNRQSGYCVDDVARLAVVALELARREDEQVWTSILYRAIAFLEDATDASTACGTSWATTAAGSTTPTRRPRRALGLGPWRDPRHRLGARRRRPERAAARHDRPHDSHECLVANVRLHRPRPRPSRPGQARPGGPERPARALEELAAAYASQRARAGSGSRTGSPMTTPACRMR